MRRAKDSKIYGLGLFLISLSLFLYMWLPLGLNAQQLQLDKVIPLTEGRLPNGGYFSPRWSPDGKKIAVTRRHYKGIYAIDIDGGGLKTITEDDGAGFRFSWSPDSEDIVYRSRKSKDNGLTKYILKSTEISTRGVTDLTTELEWVSIPSYSRTREIMYVHNSKLKQRRKTVDERTMEVEISSEENVADNVPANAIVDVPSRDKVVIEDDEGIKIMDRSGKNRKTIIRHGQNNFAVDAKVSPSSSRVLFFNNVGPIGHLYVYELETEKIVDLGEGYFGQWLPDGRIVYCIATNDGYVHTSSDLYVINADGAGKGSVCQLV